MGLSEEQKELRRTGVTATDVPKILGESPWAGPFDVWVEKVHPELAGQPDTAATRRGLRAEPFIAATYQELTGVELEEPGETFRHPRHELILATPDRFALLGGRRSYIVELKSQNWRKRAEWGEPSTAEVPMLYLLQVQWQMKACEELVERPHCDIAVAFGLEESDFARYAVPRDDELIGLMIEEVERFWRDHIVTGRPPEEVGGNERTRQALTQLYRQRRKGMLEATPALTQAAERWRQLDAEIARRQAELEEIKNAFRRVIAEDYGVAGPWGKVIWTQAKDRRVVDEKAVLAEVVERAGIPPDELEQIRERHSAVRPGGRSLRSYFDEAYFEKGEG